MNRWVAAAFVAVVALGVVLRAPQLRLRPMHNDEGVNALKFRGLYVNHNYKYDPNEFHGPTLAYFTLPAAWLGGARDFNDDTEALFRAVPVAFGVGLILLLWPLAGDLGWKQTLWAALFTALSPAMTYYSRDYIHEMLLTFFTAATFISGWRYVQTRRFIWALCGGLGLGLMAATKETFVFSGVAMALALACVRPKLFLSYDNVLRDGVAALAIALAVALLFFTSFFTNSAGIADAARAYLPWIHRAGGASPHIHPWFFYFQRLFYYHERGGGVWSEGTIGVLAVIGCLTARTALPRIIAVYTLALTVIYMALPYKTPWCLLGFYHGMILLAGIGATAAWEMCRPVWSKWTLGILLAAGCAHLGFQAWLANFGTVRGTLVCADPANPYVYAQTSPDIFRLVDTVEGLARVAPEKFDTVIEVMSPESYWPLPWYLRRFQKIGYWEKIPSQPLAPIMIVSSTLGANFDERPGKTHLMAGYFKLRPDVFLELYVRIDLWTQYVKSGAAL